MKNRRKRYYLDYNIFDMLAKGKIIYKEDKETDIFFSVAHVEEYFKALSNASPENQDSLHETKETITKISKKNIILKLY